MISITAYKKNLILKFLSKIPFIKISTWQNSNDKNINQIKFPDSSLYFKNRDIASELVKNRIDKIKTKSKSTKLNYLYDYIGKVLLLNIDFIIFKKNIKNKNKNIIIENNSIKNIINKKKELGYYFKIFFYLMRFFVFVFRIFLYSLKKNKVKHPDIIFLRKKEYYDLGLFETFKNKFTDKNIIVNGSIFIFSPKYNFNDFFYLSSYNKSSLLIIKSFFSILSLIPKIIFNINKKHINAHITYKIFIDLLLCKFVTSLDTKIFTGVLVDKPIFSLMELFKNDNQLICSLNEFFHFPPYPGFDYCNLDIYFSLNHLDVSCHNKLGGKIKKNINVPFIRNSLKPNSNGISKDLIKIQKKYEKNIVFLTSQIPSVHYFNQVEDLIFFIKNVIYLSNIFPTYLLIVKEKKNELNYLDKSLFNDLQNSKNIFLIRSIKPRKLKYNQFEDLLLISDLLVSSVFVSTTIWQGLSNKIPSISFTRYSNTSFMKEYKFLNVDKNNVVQAINYWLNISKYEFDSFLSELKLMTNISNEDGLKIISNKMNDLLKKIK